MSQKTGILLNFRQIFPLAFFCMLFVLAVLQCSYIDPDLWWHLETGKFIALHQAIPHTDLFSFTKSGSEWITHEWLSEVILYGIYRTAGWGGLIVSFSGLITAAWYLVYRRCAGRPYVAAIAVLLGGVASAPLFGIRPQMISMLFAIIYAGILTRFGEDGRTRSLWWLPPMMLLWVNLHAGFAIGLGLIGLYSVSVALDGKRNRVVPLLLALVACAAVVPINPNGFRMFSYPLETLLSPSMAAYIEEWASPNFHKFTFMPFAALLVALAATLAVVPKRARAGELFLLFVTGVAALRSMRHIPIFALIATPIVARNMWDLMVARSWERWFTKAEVRATGAVLVLNCIFLIAPPALCIFKVWHFVAHRRAYEAQRYPVKAVDFLAQQKLPGPLYNEYGWGGYLISRLYPEYRVYIDGRADVYGDEFMTESMRMFDGRFGWREPLDRRSVTTVLISPDAALASLLRDDHEWKTVYEDQQAVIFTRASSEIVSSTQRGNKGAQSSTK